MFVSRAGGLRFKSRANQIGHSIANGSPRCDVFLKGAMLPGTPSAMMQRWAHELVTLLSIIQRV